MTEILSGRTTTKFETFGKLITYFPNVQGTYNQMYWALVQGQHPLPTIMMSMNNEGEYSLLGDYSHNVLYSLSQQLIVLETPYERRRINGYTFSVIIVEPSEGQQNIITAYQLAGVI